jgi:DNA-binding HxlR family transcriptional regulator
MPKPFEKQNSLEKALQLAGKKYDLLITDCFLQNRGKRRFNQLLEDIEGINPRILSIRLKEMEKNGLITKNLVFGTPVRTVYHLSEQGEALLPVVSCFREWAEKL